MSAQVRCEPCLGMGYKGRWRMTARGKAWKLETCRACGGSGQREPRKGQRKAIRSALVTGNETRAPEVQP